LILFCDTSALVKLYLREEGSAEVMAQAQACELVVLCRIAWAEFMSALARRAREYPENNTEIEQARQRFAADWPRYLAVELTEELARTAGDHADTFALRAYDAVQLAAVQLVHTQMPGDVRFACFDTRLVKAARVMGIEAA
jgi:uncharacterized protein